MSETQRQQQRWKFPHMLNQRKKGGRRKKKEKRTRRLETSSCMGGWKRTQGRKRLESGKSETPVQHPTSRRSGRSGEKGAPARGCSGRDKYVAGTMVTFCGSTCTATCGRKRRQPPQRIRSQPAALEERVGLAQRIERITVVYPR